MRPDTANTIYHEKPSASADFSRDELNRCRFLLRRLRFLETNLREADITGNNNGAAFAGAESEALEWVLREIDFLAEVES